MTYIVDVGELVRCEDKDPRAAVVSALLLRREQPHPYSPTPAAATVLELASGEMVSFLLQPEASA